MDVPQADLRLPREHLGPYEYFPFVGVHPEHTELEAQEYWLIGIFQIEARHLMNPVVELALPVKILLAIVMLIKDFL